MTYKAFDLVVVPFPFTDQAGTKRRPALVLSNSGNFNEPCGHSVLAMITSSNNPSWPLDTEIKDLTESGLKASSVVRLKLFTLDNQLILKKIGQLSLKDRKSFKESFRKLLTEE